MHAMTGQKALDHDTWLEIGADIAKYRELYRRLLAFSGTHAKSYCVGSSLRLVQRESQLRIVE
jgi:hypothetical protein